MTYGSRLNPTGTTFGVPTAGLKQTSKKSAQGVNPFIHLHVKASMKLSIVLVNHNTCSLLKDALNALINACKNIDYEIVIIDNGSTDRSVEMIESDFPQLHLVVNETNIGIAKASNQGISECTGEYILLVNPDIICGRDSIIKMCDFMAGHSDASGLGVRMLSTKGRFLPESIHGLNKSWALFFKLIGFAKHLSKTRLYDRNRKDWVEEFQITEVDVLSGDFMMLRRLDLIEADAFDERFFTFGHNIDLCYRMRLAGYKNYYFPKTYVIHQESQPVDKFSWTYFRHFYGSMLIFALKYLLRVPEIKVQAIPRLVSPSYEVKG